MELKLIRNRNSNDATVGVLLQYEEYLCGILEDEPRTKKVWGETRIPAGRYQIKLRTTGGFHERYSKRFGEDWHKGMLHLQDVPNFKYILIHIGNDDDDTAGCLLVGTVVPGEYRLKDSTIAYKEIYPPIRDALLQGEEVWITIHD